MKILSKNTFGALLGVLFLGTHSIAEAKVCPKCVKIETARENEKASPDYKAPGYYDEWLAMNNKKELESSGKQNPKSAITADNSKESDKKIVAEADQIQYKTNGKEEVNRPPVDPSKISPSSPTDSLFLSIFSLDGLFSAFEGPYTIFVPTDSAMKNYPYLPVDKMLSQENRDFILSLISNHIVPHQILKEDFNKTFKTLGGRNVELNFENNVLTVNGARILKSEPLGARGIVYVMDQVLIPIHQ